MHDLVVCVQLYVIDSRIDVVLFPFLKAEDIRKTAWNETAQKTKLSGKKRQHRHKLVFFY